MYYPAAFFRVSAFDAERFIEAGRYRYFPGLPAAGFFVLLVSPAVNKLMHARHGLLRSLLAGFLLWAVFVNIRQIHHDAERFKRRSVMLRTAEERFIRDLNGLIFRRREPFRINDSRFHSRLYPRPSNFLPFHFSEIDRAAVLRQVHFVKIRDRRTAGTGPETYWADKMGRLHAYPERTAEEGR